MINLDSITEQTKKLFLLIAEANQNHWVFAINGKANNGIECYNAKNIRVFDAAHLYGPLQRVLLVTNYIIPE